MYPRMTTVSEPLAPKKGSSVLVVANDARLRDVLRLSLQRSGFEVYVARTGPEGLALYRRCSLDIDIVLLDVEMADEDGPKTFTTLREVDPRACCCFLAGDHTVYTAEQLLGWGAAQVFEKPLSLVAVTRSLVELASM